MFLWYFMSSQSGPLKSLTGKYSASQHTPPHSSALHFYARPTPPLSPDLIRATHARPLHPAALASVPFGIVLVRVRVRDSTSSCLYTTEETHSSAAGRKSQPVPALRNARAPTTTRSIGFVPYGFVLVRVRVRAGLRALRNQKGVTSTGYLPTAATAANRVRVPRRYPSTTPAGSPESRSARAKGEAWRGQVA